MADTYGNPLINHISGSTDWNSNNGWTPPASTGDGDSWYQDTTGSYVGGGADGAGAEYVPPTGNWQHFSNFNGDWSKNKSFVENYDKNGSLLDSQLLQRSNRSALEGGWIPALGLLAGGLGMFGGGGLSSLFGGAGEGAAASLGGDAFSTIAAENAAGGLSALTPTSVGSFGPVASVTAGGSGAGAGGLGSLFSGNGLSGIGDFLKNPLFSGAPAGLTGMTGLSSLYDLYAKNKMAGEQKSRYDQIQNQINGGYSPGSPEFEYMKQELARKDARAGRNSQYGPRAVELQARVADIKNRNLASTQTGQNQLQSSYLNNEYGGLNSLFGYLNKAGATQKILGQ